MISALLFQTSLKNTYPCLYLIIIINFFKVILYLYQCLCFSYGLNYLLFYIIISLLSEYTYTYICLGKYETLSFCKHKVIIVELSTFITIVFNITITVSKLYSEVNTMTICKKLLSFVLALLLTLMCLTVSTFAEDNPAPNEDQYSYLDVGVLSLSNLYTAKEMLSQSRFYYAGGHGFAAEEANNLIDILSGKNAKVVGYDNAANGADRLITRSGEYIFIQTKYWSTAEKTISSAFDNTKGGVYKYMNSDGTPMQLEVPSDQYDDVVRLFSDKIKNGKVEGVTDPNEAKNIVRKGNVTYEQSVNITKAGKIESLIYDSAKGCVTAATAFGISTTLDFAIRNLNGEEWDEALKNSATVGLKTGANAFAIYVITSQLSKANVAKVFEPGAQALVNTFGDDFAKTLIKAYGVNKTTTTGARNAAKQLLQSQTLAATVTIVVISLPDAVDMIRGRISAKQMIKNLAITTASVAGGTIGAIAGSAAGTAIAPGVGSAVGGTIGGVAGGVAAGMGAEALLSIVIEDDAEEMLEIIQNVFHDEAVNYLATEEEAESVAESLSYALTGKTLKDMFESENKEEFASKLICPLFDEIVSKRPIVKMPTSEEMRYELKEQLKGVVFIH